MVGSLVPHPADRRSCVDVCREGSQPSHAADLLERRSLTGQSLGGIERPEVLERHEGSAGLAGPFDDDALAGRSLVEEFAEVRPDLKSADGLHLTIIGL